MATVKLRKLDPSSAGITLPVGLDAQRMPVGLQLLRQPGGEPDLLAVGQAAEAVLGTGERRLGTPPARVSAG